MKVPLFWLRELCDPGLDPVALAERLAMTGTEVERVSHHGVGALDAFVVGRVLTAERHPDADRLSVCTVAVGEGDTAHIVCGAPNVAAGQTVAVARPGAVMPGGTRLGRAKLRGVVSEGMILAEDEVAVGTDHGGIMVLDDDLVPGTPLADVLPIATPVLELEITPNRPDCLGIYGIAREVHAATGAPLAPPPWEPDPGGPGPVPGAEVRVEAPEGCPRFTARLFEDVRIGPSPLWLKARLTAAGQRPISNVVDITNYVMLLTGQPLHAFDFEAVAGGRLVVRRAAPGESLETLDGVRRVLDEDAVLICDDDGPTSLAGIMGGGRSEVGPGTTRVLMEAATWIGPNIQGTSSRLGLRSEASARFEKGLSPEAALEAQAVATRLMVEVCGARLVGGTIDVGGAPPAAPPLRLRDRTIGRLLGMDVPRADAARTLAALDFGTGEAEDGLEVRVPHFRRFDVTREADLVEEVARFRLAELPSTLPSRRGATGLLTRAQRHRRRVEDALVGAGASEAVGWSFTDPGLADRLRLGPEDPRRRPVPLQNPLSEDASVLRTLLLGSLLDSARRNVHRGRVDVRLWEIGAVYLAAPPGAERAGPLPEEPQHLGVLLVGAGADATWRQPSPPPADVWAAKGVLGAALDALRLLWRVEPLDDFAAHPFLHPGRGGLVLVEDAVLGWIGELHPRVTATWDLERAAGFEIDLGRAVALAPELAVYEDLTSFPAVRQDIAVVVGDDVAAARVVDVVRAAGAPILVRVDVFDVYRGAQIGEGRQSLALRLEFRAPDRTLTDAEVAERRAAITGALRDELRGELRA